MKRLTKILFFIAAILTFWACNPIIEPESNPTVISFNPVEDTVTIQVNTELDFSLEVTVLNPKETTVFTAENLTSWATLTSNGNAATIKGTPTEVGKHNVILKATNNKEVAEKEITIIVVSAISFNPVEETVTVQVNTELDFSLEVTVSNPIGATVFTAENLPSWATLTSNGNVATIKGTPTEVNVHSVTLKATNNNNVAEQKINIIVISASVARTLLLEKFTGDQCVYCPWGADWVETAIEGNESRVIEVAHHVGYNEDRYTITQSKPLTFLFGSNGTYAPACMIDRRIISDVKEDDGPVFCPVGKTKFNKNLINKQLEIPSYVTINLNTTYNPATRELSVEVTGVLGKFYPNAKLNVYIIQEGLTSKQTAPVDASGNYVTYKQYQSGTSPKNGSIADYPHKHALRAVLTETAWGDALGVEIGSYSKSYTYTLPESIKGTKNIEIPTDADNMYVVAFVADYIKNTTENLGKSEVHNAAIKKFGE